MLLQAAAEIQAFVDELKRCRALPREEKPSIHHWQGQQLQRLQAVQAYALESANEAQTALAHNTIHVSSTPVLLHAMSIDAC